MGSVTSDGSLTIVHENGEKQKIPAEMFAFEAEVGLGPGGGSGNKINYTFREDFSFESGDQFELVVEVREIYNGLNGPPSVEVYPNGNFELEVDDSDLNLGIEPT